MTGQLAGAVPAAHAEEQPTVCDPYCYNSDYLFGVTRDLHDCSGSPAVVALVSPLTIALDLVILPFEIALGLFG